MPSFDVVSDFDAHEAANGVDQANREVNTRFDFKGTGSKFVLDQQLITLTTQSDFQLKQMIDILHQKLSKRGINIACLEEEDAEVTNNGARQQIILRRGIDADRARKLVKQIKAAKLKVQAAIRHVEVHLVLSRVKAQVRIRIECGDVVGLRRAVLGADLLARHVFGTVVGGG